MDIFAGRTIATADRIEVWFESPGLISEGMALLNSQTTRRQYNRTWIMAYSWCCLWVSGGSFHEQWRVSIMKADDDYIRLTGEPIKLDADQLTTIPDLDRVSERFSVVLTHQEIRKMVETANRQQLEKSYIK